MSLKRNSINAKKTERILQFGEGNFLRAFVDWIVEETNKKTGFDAGIVVVQPIEKGLVDILNEQDGLYTLYLNGIKDGKAVRENSIISSITRGINPYDSFEDYIKTAENENMRFIVSNTTEAGIAFDKRDALKDMPQKSYPGKLTAWLYKRYQFFNGASDKGMIIIPCELIDKNADVLKETIYKYIELWELPDEFKDWMEKHNIFCNSLVDRIVPGYPKDRMDEILNELKYEDKLVVEGEQFHLWVIEGDQRVKDEFPVEQTGLNVIFTDDVTPYKKRKVRILNGAHTTMVPAGMLHGIDTVRNGLNDKDLGQFLKEAIFEEIIPTLDLPKEELIHFAEDVLDRFNNPYIKHYLKSIALNSNSKFETRVLPSILQYKELKGQLPERLTFAFACLITLYKGEYVGSKMEINDSKEILDMYHKLWEECDNNKEDIVNLVSSVLSKEEIWKFDLNTVEGLTEKVSQYVYDLVTNQKVF